MLVILSFIALDAEFAAAQTTAWTADLAAAALVEAWDANESSESLAGMSAGIDRRVVGPVAARAEGLLFRVAQDGDDAWVRGFTIGARSRWSRSRMSTFLGGRRRLAHATVAVPVRGTRFNYLAVLGGGIEVPIGGIQLALGARWLHVSNNGREGRQRNPDIQSLGAVVGVGWNNVF